MENVALTLFDVESEAYQARTLYALKCEDESYLRYTKYLEFTLLHDGEPIKLSTPVKVTVCLDDVSEGAGALQAVRFGRVACRLLESELAGRTISFSANDLGVFGIGNALMPLTIGETELAAVEVLGYDTDAPVSLTEAEAPATDAAPKDGAAPTGASPRATRRISSTAALISLPRFMAW